MNKHIWFLVSATLLFWWCNEKKVQETKQETVVSQSIQNIEDNFDKKYLEQDLLSIDYEDITNKNLDETNRLVVSLNNLRFNSNQPWDLYLVYNFIIPSRKLEDEFVSFLRENWQIWENWSPTVSEANVISFFIKKWIIIHYDRSTNKLIATHITNSWKASVNDIDINNLATLKNSFNNNWDSLDVIVNYSQNEWGVSWLLQEKTILIWDKNKYDRFVLLNELTWVRFDKFKELINENNKNILKWKYWHYFFKNINSLSPKINNLATSRSDTEMSEYRWDLVCIEDNPSWILKHMLIYWVQIQGVEASFSFSNRKNEWFKLAIEEVKKEVPTYSLSKWDFSERFLNKEVLSGIAYKDSNLREYYTKALKAEAERQYKAGIIDTYKWNNLANWVYLEIIKSPEVLSAIRNRARTQRLNLENYLMECTR